MAHIQQMVSLDWLMQLVMTDVYSYLFQLIFEHKRWGYGLGPKGFTLTRVKAQNFSL